MNTFQKWVAAKGGAEKVAPMLGVTAHAIRRWLRKETTPRTETIRKIQKLSRKRVQLADLLN